MARLYEHLASLIVHDNAVLLIGADLGRGSSGAFPTYQVADTLAQRLGQAERSRPLSRVAQEFETLLGRQALVQALKEEVERLEASQLPLARLVADAVVPGTKVVTSRFDRALERALEARRTPYVRIVRDTDLPFFDESKVTVIKIQGDIDQPDSLVVTDDDLDEFVRRLPTVSDVVRAFFATKTLVFLGYDLAGLTFKRLFGEISRELKGFRRTAYAVAAEALPEVEQRYWQQRGVELLAEDPTAFLQGLAAAMARARQQPLPPANPLAALAEPPRPDRPYKALATFDAADAAIFFGREEESQRLANRILGRPITLLYGESGSGKSSLLRAGVTPLLAHQRSLLAVLEPQPAQPPNEAIADALAQAGRRAGLSLPDRWSSPADLVRAWQDTLDGPLVLAVDPLEPLLLAPDPAAQEAWLRCLAELVDNPALFLRLVLVTREDFLGRLAVVEPFLPGLWDGRFRLERLGREEARAAVVEPAGVFGVRWQPALVEALLDSLGDDRGIAPAALQIVCDRLYAAATDEQPPATEITLAHLQRLGGVEAILGDYLEGVLANLPAAQQPLAQRLLAALVSSQGVRQRLALGDLARTADCPPNAAAAVLDELVRQRLAVRYDAADPEYTLVHDYLTPRIARWLGPAFWDEQRGRELLRAALPGWERDRRLPALDALRLATRYQGTLRLTPAETAMFYAAAVAYGRSPEPWQQSLSADQRRRCLEALLANDDPAVRRQAAEAAADPLLALRLASLALDDPSAAVREAAAVSLGAAAQSEPTAFLSAPVHEALQSLAAATAQPTTAEAGLAALAAAVDQAPALRAALPPGLRRPVCRRVLAQRWARSRQQIALDTAQAAQWGYLSMAATLGVVFGLVSAAGAQRPITAVSIVVLGIAVAGVIGAAAVGVGGFLGSVLRHLDDPDHGLRHAALTALAVAATFALGWVLLLAGLPGSFAAGGVFLTVVLASLAVAAAALALPRSRLSRPAQAAVAAAVGAVAFALAAWLGREAGMTTLSLSPTPIIGIPPAPLIGLAAGVGFLAGLNPRLWRERPQHHERGERS